MNTTTIKGAMSALEAIQARIHGEFDHPSLMLYGPLSTSKMEDVLYIAHEGLVAEKKANKAAIAKTNKVQP